MPWTNDQTWALVNKPEPEEIRLVDLINKPDPEEIYHHGIKGQKWGIRRYQNPDGSLTPEGKKRYLHEDGSLNEKGIKRAQFGTSREQRDSLAKELTRLDDEKNSKNKKKESDDLLSRFEKIKKEDPEIFKKIVGDEKFDPKDDPEITELVLMEYEDYKKGNGLWNDDKDNKKSISASSDDFIKDVESDYGNMFPNIKDHIKKYGGDSDGDFQKLRDNFEKNLMEAFEKRWDEQREKEKEADKKRDDYCKKETGMDWEQLYDEAYSGRHKEYDKTWEVLNNSEELWDDIYNQISYSDLYDAQDTLELMDNFLKK